MIIQRYAMFVFVEICVPLSLSRAIDTKNKKDVFVGVGIYTRTNNNKERGDETMHYLRYARVARPTTEDVKNIPIYRRELKKTKRICLCWQLQMKTRMNIQNIYGYC